MAEQQAWGAGRARVMRAGIAVLLLALVGLLTSFLWADGSGRVRTTSSSATSIASDDEPTTIIPFTGAHPLQARRKAKRAKPAIAERPTSFAPPRAVTPSRPSGGETRRPRRPAPARPRPQRPRQPAPRPAQPSPPAAAPDPTPVLPQPPNRPDTPAPDVLPRPSNGNGNGNGNGNEVGDLIGTLLGR